MLSDLNPHEKDADTSFEPIEHVYMHVPSGKTFPTSVTSLISPSFPSDFDKNKIVDANFHKWANDRNHKYYAMIRYIELVQKKHTDDVKEAIKALWDAEGEVARNDGTDMHAELEDWMNGIHPDGQSKHAYAVTNVEYALKNQPFKNMDLRPYRTEFRVFLTAQVTHPQTPERVHTIPIISGTIDALWWSNLLKQFFVVDWKRVNPQVKGFLGKGSDSKFKKMAQGRFSKFSNTEFHKYSLQLIIYKLILERGGYLKPGQKIGALFLCQLHPCMERAHFVEALSDMDEESADEFEKAAGELLDDYIELCKQNELKRLDELEKSEEKEEKEESVFKVQKTDHMCVE
jgi:hypothetical protein